MARHFRISPILPPALHKQREKLLVLTYVIVIRLSLLPYHTLDRKLLHWGNCCIKKITRSVWVFGGTGFRISQILFSHRYAPSVENLIIKPRIEDFRLFGLQSRLWNPRLCRSSSNRIADKTDRNIQTFTQQGTEMISHRRKIPHVFPIADHP